MPQDLNVVSQEIAPAIVAAVLASNQLRPLQEEIYATKYVRRMRGGSHACLLRCSDAAHYVVKVQNNPQGRRILANELLGTLLAKKLSLPVAEPAVINVSREFIRGSSEMVIKAGHSCAPMHGGRCFGSQVPRYGEPNSSRNPPLEFVHEPLPSKQAKMVANVADVAGMLVFDKWTCNTDGRQTIFVQNANRQTYRAIMIDQGFCFNGIEWSFPDAGLYCIGLYNSVFDRIPSFSTFEPWLDYLENKIDREILAKLAEQVPPEWYEYNRDALRRLLDQLDLRRLRIAELIFSIWRIRRHSFPNRTRQSNCASTLCR